MGPNFTNSADSAVPTMIRPYDPTPEHPPATPSPHHPITPSPTTHPLTSPSPTQTWLQRFQAKKPSCVCVLGFTETALIPGISAAGATPRDRQITALADAEFLHNGPMAEPTYALPPLAVGVSPAFISRAVLQAQAIPLTIFNAGLPQSPTVPHVDLGGQVAHCVRTGQALPPTVVEHLFQTGLDWGQRLAITVPDSYLILGECVVGGTTTALAVLTGLGQAAMGKVNSSHPTCNHQQKQAIATEGLQNLNRIQVKGFKSRPLHPRDIVAAVGDPMQPVVAGMAIAASRSCGVLLAGGTQMLAVHALIQAWATVDALPWRWENIMVGTTRWVADDPTGDTVGLARSLNVPLLATQLNFGAAHYLQLQMYEQGFVKEGVAAGGCAIASTLYQNWGQDRILNAIETLVKQHLQTAT